MSMTASTTQAAPVDRLDDLAQIIRAYNEVTDNLQRSHEALRAEVARLQRELASTDAQLQRSKRLAALGEMAAGIAHEIRNPLAAIALYARMLVEDLQQPPEEITWRSCGEVAGKIASAVRGLDAVVNDVLTFARELRPRRLAVYASQLFDRALEAHRPAIDATGVRIVRHDSDELLIDVDADLMQQAILNVIRNAVDAMPDGGTLTLQTRVEESQVALVIRDTGPGIADVDIDRIFNPFFTTRSTGTGLGLAIVHRILDAHHGTITVHNDGGAVFELILPRHEASGDVAAHRAQQAAIGVVP